MRRDVSLYKNPQKAVTVDDEATKGSIVGVNLVLEDGTILSANDVVTSLGTANDVRNILGIPVEQLFSPTGSLIIDLVSWENIQSIPANVVEVENLTGSGLVRKGSPWTAGTAVAYSEIQNVTTTDRLLGRASAGSGVIEEVPCTAFARTLIDDATASDARTTLGLTSAATATFVAATSFTPVVIGTTAAGAGTYTTQIGRYQRIGNIVSYSITLVWTAHTGTGNIRISGLPIAASGSGRWAQSIQASDLTWGAGQLQAAIIGGESLIRLYNVASGAAEAEFAIDTAASIHISGIYEV